MKEKTTNRKSSILMPALIGSAVGAGIALLLAPKKGKEIRNDLKRLAANTRDQVAKVIDGGRKLFGKGEGVVAEAVTTVKETYDEGTERLEKLVTGELKPIAAKTRNTFVSAVDKGKTFYTEGRRAISKGMGAGQKEYLRKNVKHHHAA